MWPPNSRFTCAREHQIGPGSASGVGSAVPDIFAGSGSLAAFLWLQAARAVNADASIATYTRLGLILASLMLAGSLGVLLPIAAHGF